MRADRAVPLHGDEAASAWVQRWTPLVREHGRVLDVASGRGRHARWMAAQGHFVTLVDRSAEAVAAVGLPADRCEALVADLEDGAWPFPGRRFDAVVVTHYLWRPLLPTLVNSLSPGGVLIYETFAAGNETIGKPSRPDFLLQPGELLEACQSLRVVAFEDGFEPQTDGALLRPARFVQRIAAVAADPDAAAPLRHRLA